MANTLLVVKCEQCHRKLNFLRDTESVARGREETDLAEREHLEQERSDVLYVTFAHSS